MSKVTIAGDVNGTGVFTIAAPNGNTNRTLTLPDEAGTILTTATAGVPIGGPAFSAYQSSSQTISAATATKILFQTELFDTNSNYSTSTSEFIPTVAGYYQVSTAVRIAGSTSRMLLAIRKNNVKIKVLQDIGSSLYALGGSVLIYMNGTTDYLTVFIEYSAAGGGIENSAADTYFEAVMVRSA